MAFDDNKAALVQEHFSVVEIDLPAFAAGTCTFAAGTAYFTPLTCDETWNGSTLKTYYFSTPNLPLTYGRPPSSTGMPVDIIELDGAAVYPVISSISEDVTELRPGEGLAIQGTASISLVDFEGDPGPETTSENGTFFGKLAARNILNNKEVRIKHYHVNSDGIYADDDALTRYYVLESFESNGKGAWSAKLKDELSKLDDDKSQFPIPTDGSLRADIDDSVTAIPVDSATDWSATGQAGAIPYTIKIGDELMKVTSVANNLTASAELTVNTRGADIVFTNTLSTATADSHSINDDIQICHTSDNQRIDNFLEIVLESSGIDSALIPNADWTAEIDDWHPTDKINTIWHEPVAANDVVKQVTVGFLLDIWFDPVDREVKLSAITVWKSEGPLVEQGKGINRDTFKVSPKDNKRYSRAFIYYNKPDKVKNDDIENYRSLSVSIFAEPESAGLFGEPKTKEFESSNIIGTNAADLLVARTTARFGFTPEQYSWMTEERFLNFSTGDIATISTKEKQDADGNPKEVRGQILSVQPMQSNKDGRRYKVKALTYEVAFADGSEFTITANTSDLNIHTFVGAPSQAVSLTVVIDGANISSSVAGNTAIVAGAFASGSDITLILKDSSELQAAGGAGGEAGGPFSTDGEDGIAGDAVYDAQGIDTEIYLGGTIDTHTALGTIKAPGGGGGGAAYIDIIGVAGGGGGGAGSVVGVGGPGFGGSSEDGSDGDTVGNGGTGNGTIPGATGGAWGATGGAWGGASGAGGLAGKGLIKGGATVNIYTDGNTSRFINGSGDSPDSLT